jgi:protein involved in polysaccharide export with SLBB domain
MKRIKYTLLLFLVGVFTSLMGYTQGVSDSQLKLIQSELKSRGLTEKEVRDRLSLKGVMIDNLSPADIPTYQPIILSVLNELEAEKKQQVAPAAPTSSTTAPTATSTQGTPTAPVTISPINFGNQPSQEELASEVSQNITAQATPNDGIYGHSLFSDQTLEVFRTTDGAKVPDSYRLGAGDKLRVTLFGSSQIDLILEINTEGFVQPTGMPMIFLKGINLGQAKELVKQRFSSYYRFQDDQFSLTVQTARTVTINIFGETKVKGSFTFSALNTAFNALAAAGGPTPLGSVRNIQLLRGSTSKILDVYDFMLNPAKKFEFELQEDDIIFVPFSEKLVTITGAVKRPMTYELVKAEGLKELIAYAGGVNFNTNPEFVQIERIQNGEVVLLEWNLSDILSGKVPVSLQDGDQVRLREITKVLENFVTLEGEVFYPGSYDLTKGTTLGSILKKAELKPEAATNGVIIEREERDNSKKILFPGQDSKQYEKFELQGRDKIIVYSKQRFADFGTIEVSGEVRNPFSRTVVFGDKLLLQDVLLLAGGLTPNAADEAFVFRRDLFNTSKTEYLRVNLKQEEGFELSPGDRLLVYNKNRFVDGLPIYIGGSVKSPQQLRYDTSLSLRDLFYLAGGPTPSAALDRVDVFRLKINEKSSTNFERLELQIDSTYQILSGPENFVLMPYDQVILRDIPLFDSKRTIQLSGQVLYPGTYALSSERVFLSELIEQAGGLTAIADEGNATFLRTYGKIGPVSINFKKAMENKRNPRFDPLVLEGDVITIPTLSTTIGIRSQATRLENLVELSGARERNVYYFNYQGKKSAKWYIRQHAGGFAEKVDKSSLTALMPNGQVKGTTSILGLAHKYPEVSPGDILALDFKAPKPEKEAKKPVDWDKIANTVIQGTLSTITLLLLVRNF